MRRVAPLAVAGLIASLAVIGSAGNAWAADTNPHPTSQVISFDHYCHNEGNYIGLSGALPSEGVTCADLEFRLVTNSGAWEVQARASGEAICQPYGGGSPMQCAGVKQDVGLYQGYPSTTLIGSASGVCGLYFTNVACPYNARFYSRTGWIDTGARLPITLPGGWTYACDGSQFGGVWTSVTNITFRLPGSGKMLQRAGDHRHRHGPRRELLRLPRWDLGRRLQLTTPIPAARRDPCLRTAPGRGSMSGSLR